MITGATTYEIRVNCHLDDHWSAWLGDVDLTRNDDGTTTVTVSVADQAQLHGVLAGLRDIGAVLTALRTSDPPAQTCGPGARTHPADPTPQLATRENELVAAGSVTPVLGRAFRLPDGAAAVAVSVTGTETGGSSSRPDSHQSCR